MKCGRHWMANRSVGGWQRPLDMEVAVYQAQVAQRCGRCGAGAVVCDCMNMVKEYRWQQQQARRE